MEHASTHTSNYLGFKPIAFKKPLSVVEFELLDSPESSDLLEPLELLSLDVGIQADPINGWLSTLRSD